MIKESRSYPLLAELMNRPPLSWRLKTVLIAAILLIPLIVIAQLEGALDHQPTWEFWRTSIFSPVIIIYTLIVYPFVLRLWNTALESYRPLVSMSEEQFNQLAVECTLVKRRYEWLAVFFGFIFVVVLFRPWEWVDSWRDVYQVITNMLMFGLLSWLIYSLVYGSRKLSKLSQQNLILDIFNTKLLSPMARLSLGNSLSFVGGISLSLVFQTQEGLLEWQSIVIYSVLVLATIVIFYISNWNIHKMMVNMKRREMDVVQEQLATMSRKLKELSSDGQIEGLADLSSSVAGWSAYKNQVQETPEWPFNAGIIRRLFASVLAPASIYLIKILSTLGIRISF